MIKDLGSGRRHEVIVHCIQFGAEHDERCDPLVQIMIKIWVADMKSSCIAPNLMHHVDAVCPLQAGSLMPILLDSVAKLLRVE